MGQGQGAARSPGEKHCVNLSPPSLHGCSVAQLCPTLCDPMECTWPTPLFMAFSRQEYWSRLPFPPPGDFFDPGIEPISSALVGGFFTTEPPGKPDSFID